MNQIASRVGLVSLLVAELGATGCASGTSSGGEPGSGLDAGVIVVSMVADSAAAEDAQGSAPDDSGDAPAVEPDDAADVGADAAPAGEPEATSSDGDGGAPCSSGESACAGICVDTLTDVNNCGQCGTSCTATMANAIATCSEGTCSFACSAGSHACGATCASDSSLDSCGTACVACPAAPVSHATEACVASGSSYACQWSCAAGYLLCGGACVDPTSDVANCGSCGHACTPGTCSAGACAPWVLADSPHPVAVVADGTNVIWADDTGAPGIFQVPATNVASGPSPAAPLALASFQSPGIVDGLALEGSSVLCTQTVHGQVSSAFTLYLATEGSTTGPGGVWVPPSEPRGMAVSDGQTSDGSVYLNTTNGTTVTIWWCDIAELFVEGDGSPPCYTLTTYSGSTLGLLAADADGVFWTDPANSLVSHYLFADQNVSSVAQAQTGASLIALDAQNVYWVTTANGTTLNAASKQSPGAPIALASGTGPLGSIVSDGAHVYLVERGAQILSVPAGGGSLGTVYKVPGGSGGSIGALAYASGALYWADASLGQVFGLRTP